MRTIRCSHSRRSQKWRYIILVTVLAVAAATLAVWRRKLIMHEPTAAVADRKFIYDLVDISKTAANFSADAFPCPTGHVAGLSFPICTFSAVDDRWVSVALLGRGSYWEKTSVWRVVDTLYQLDRTHPVFFIDIGANIGAYSLAAAHAGVQVIAVEINWEAINRLAKSASLGNISKRIQILHNAVLNISGSSVDVEYRLRNPGGSLVRSNEACKERQRRFGQIPDSICLSGIVTSLTLNDLLSLVKTTHEANVEKRPKILIKADVEGSELEVFTERSAGKFFDSVDVEAVQMEWAMIRGEFNDVVARRQAVAEMVQFFVKRGYVFHSADDASLGSDSLNAHDWMQWNMTNVWIKKKRH